MFGAFGFASLACACSENTERVLTKVPEANASVATGGVAGIGGNTSTSVGGASAGSSSGGASGAKMSAVGTPLGFAAQGTGATTGGGAQVPDVPADCFEMSRLLTDGSPRVIVIKGTMDCTVPAQQIRTCEIQCDSTTGDTKLFHRLLSDSPEVVNCSGVDGATASTTIAGNYTKNAQSINVASNKTLLGVGSNATISGANLMLVSTASNIIIQNLTFTNVNPQLVEAGDAITIDGANHIWIDHCAFNQISDGFIDMPSPSSGATYATFVTVSWNHFDGRNDYACGKQHNYANTIENATVTFHHNFWDHTLGTSPKVTKANARAHLFNNYWLNVLYYSIGVDKNAQALVEYNDFNDSKRPYWGMNTCIADGTCAISDSSGSNIFEGVSSDSAESKNVGGTVAAFPYSVTPTVAKSVKDDVTQGAGPTLAIALP